MTGVENGWLDEARFLPAAEKAWNSIADRVNEDGTVELVLGGTGIQNDEASYAPSTTDYRVSAPGMGGVLRGMAAAARFWGNAQK